MELTDYIWRWINGRRPWWRGPEVGALVCAGAGAAAYQMAPATAILMFLFLPFLHVFCCSSAFKLALELQRLRITPELLATPIGGAAFIPVFRRVFWRTSLSWVLVALLCYAAVFSVAWELAGMFAILMSPLFIWLFLAEFAVLRVIFWTAVLAGVPAGLLLMPFYGLFLVGALILAAVLQSFLHWEFGALALLGTLVYIWTAGNDMVRTCSAGYTEGLRARLEAAEK